MSGASDERDHELSTPPGTRANETKPTAEQLAMLLDQRLADDERAKVLASLDADPELREVLSDAAAVLAEVTSSAAPYEGSASRGPRRIGPRIGRDIWLAVAAVLVIAIVFPLTRYTRQSEGLPPVERIALALESTGPTSATNERPWREFRGAGEPISRRGRAVRLGALLTDLDLLAARRDTAVSTIAAQIAMLLDEYPGGTAVADTYRAMVRDGAAGDAASRSRGTQAVEMLSGESALRVGAWLEAARIAAHNRDASFFAQPVTAIALRVASSVASDSSASLDVALLSTMTAPAGRDWDKLSRAIDAALSGLAN